MIHFLSISLIILTTNRFLISDLKNINMNESQIVRRSKCSGPRYLVHSRWKPERDVRPLKNNSSCIKVTLSNFPNAWSEMQKNSKLCDGIVYCDDGIHFHIHCVILCAASPYFNKVFTSTDKGSSNEKHLSFDCPSLHLKEQRLVYVNVPSNIMQLIIEYIYTGNCRLTEGNFHDILDYAEELEVYGLILKTSEFVMKRLTVKNCIAYWETTINYFCFNLESEIGSYICRNFLEVLEKSDEFDDIGPEKFQELLSHDELNIKEEKIVFLALKRWIEKDFDERISTLPKLISCIRFGLISQDYYMTIIRKWPHWNRFKICQKTLRHADMYHTSIPTQKISYVTRMDLMVRPRVPYDIIFTIGGWTTGNPTSFVETYDNRSNRWLFAVNADKTPRAYHGSCSLAGMIYVIGGYNGDEPFSSVRCYNPVSHKWKEVSCMNYPRCYVSVVVLNGHIYSIGGFNGRTRMNSVERYDPIRNQWYLMAPLQRHRSDASATVMKGKIYVAGGFNGTEVLNSVEVYDPVENKWSMISPMNEVRSGLSLVSHKGVLYVLGGFNGFSRLATGEKIDPDFAATWQTIPPMLFPRSNFAATVLDNKIYVIGGFDGTTTISSVETYNPERKIWEYVASMNLNRSAASACVVSNLPNCREYSCLWNYFGRRVPKKKKLCMGF